jgi:hypothetical protein
MDAQTITALVSLVNAIGAAIALIIHAINGTNGSPKVNGSGKSSGPTTPAV